MHSIKKLSYALLTASILTQVHSMETEENKFSENQSNPSVNNTETQSLYMETEENKFSENQLIHIECPALTYRKLEFAVNFPLKDGEKMAIVLNNEIWWINSQEAKVIDDFSLTKGHRRRFELNYGVGDCYRNDKFELVGEDNSIADKKYRCVYRITRGETAITFSLTKQYSDVGAFCKSVTACHGLSTTQHHAGWEIVASIIQKK